MLGSEGRGALGPVTVNPRAIKSALPNSAHPTAAPEDAANKRAACELPRSKQPTAEHTRFKHAAAPLAFEQRGTPIDRIGSKLLIYVQLTAEQDRRLLSVWHREHFKSSARSAARKVSLNECLGFVSAKHHSCQS